MATAPSVVAIPSLAIAVLPASALERLVDSPLSQAASVAFAWTLVTVTVAAILAVAVPQYARGRRDDAADRPDTAFAVGFITCFGILICAALPLFVGTALEHATLIAIGRVVGLPAVNACAALVIAGSGVGVIVVGDRLGDWLGSGPPSLGRTLAIGTVALGASHLVPILGTIVTIAVATVGAGAIVSNSYERRAGKPLLASSTDDGLDRESVPQPPRPGRNRAEPNRSSDPHENGSESTPRAVRTAPDATGGKLRRERTGDPGRRFEYGSWNDQTPDRPSDGDGRRDDGARDADERRDDTK